MYALRDQKRTLEAALKEEQHEKRILEAALKEEQSQKSDYKQECERLRKKLESVQEIEISQLKEGNLIFPLIIKINESHHSELAHMFAYFNQ